ncbi:MAG: STY4526/YPO1902 family pathogenicity island replication protein [Betaproteobacteria bacterium]
MTGVDPRVQLLALAFLLATAAPETSPNAPALRRLRELSSEDLVQLVNAGYPRAEVTLDFRSIEHGLRMIRDRRDHDARLDHFIQHGATTALMHQLFRVPVAAIKARRVQLLGKHRQRRPRMPRPHVRDAIHAAWWQIRGGGGQNRPTVEQYVALHERFAHLSYATLYAVINEFEDAPSAPPRG